MKHNYKRFLAMVMAVVMIVGMVPMNVFAADGDDAAQATNSSLVAFYDFSAQDTGTVYDASGNGNNATLINGAKVSADPRGVGYVLDLVSNGRASTAKGLALPAEMFKGIEDVTIVMDIRLETTDTWMCLLNAGVSGQQLKYMTFVNEGNDDNTLNEDGEIIGACGISNATSDGNGSESAEKRVYAEWGTMLQPGVWGRVALRHVASTGEAQIYLNNVLVASGKLDATLQHLVQDEGCEVRIGSNNIWNDPGLNGLVDNIRVYNKALSEAELAAIPDVTIDTEAELIDAVAAGGTVTLGGNISLQNNLVVPEGVTVVLDLNGYNLTRTNASAWYNCVIENLGSLTIKGEGTLSVGNGSAVISKGTLVIDGGTYASYYDNVFVQSGTLTINDGTFAGSVNGNGITSITVTGGTFGEFKNMDSAVITGGNYKWELENTLPEGYVLINNGDGTWSVVPECKHPNTTTTTVDATCTADGSVTVTCDDCGNVDTTVIEATGHNAGDEATCTAPQTCTVCGEELAAALGHSYVDGACTVCGGADPDYVAPITGTITEDTVWADGTVVGDVTISGDVTITVNGTVTVTGTIAMYTDSIHTVTIQGGTDDAKLIRGNGFTGQMFYVEGTTHNFQNLNVKDITLDGGAVWTGETDAILNRGTVNEGIKATGSVLYLVRANAVLDNVTLQNHDDAAVGEKASAVFLRYYATVAFNNSIARNNNNSEGYWKGGVVCTRQGGTVTTDNSEVYGNSAVHGGFVGVASSGSYGTKVECVNTKLHHNYASTNGGVFYLQDNGGTGYVKLTGCTVENNGSALGLFYSHVYFVPTWIKDTTFTNNACSMYEFNSDNRGFSVAGNTKFSSDYSKYLFKNPVRIFGALDSTASIPMSEASASQLMNNYGYLVTATPDIDYHYNHTGNGTYILTYEYTSDTLYTITQADLAQVKLYEGNGYTGWVMTDVDGNGMLDAVPVSVDPTTVNVTLTDTFKGASETQTQDVSNVVENVPVCYYEHPGYFFNGWLKEDGTLIKDASSNVILNGGENLTAAWAVARPTVAVTSSASLVQTGKEVTLTATIGNQDAEHLAYTYQWYRSGTAVEGATEATYTTTETDAGYYTYKCVVTATDADYNSDTDYATLTTYGTNTYNKSLTVQFTDAPVASDCVAQIEETGEQFETLAEAVEAANALEKATITMLADITLGEKLTVTGNVTIQGEHTLTRDAAYTGTFFDVPAEATLTLDGGLTIDGGNHWTMDMDAYNEDLYNMTQVLEADYEKYFTIAENEPVADAYMIDLFGGNLNLNDVTIENHYGRGSGIVYADHGVEAHVTLTGAKVTHCANVTNGGLLVAINGTGSTVTMNAGTVVDGNHVEGNHGIFRMYNGSLLIMNGGEIRNTTGVNSNGTAIGLYYAELIMNDGLICSNSSVWGKDNQRNPAVYVHSGAKMTMNGGTICHNIGKEYGGGIGSYKPSSDITINGGKVIHNVSLNNDNRTPGVVRGDDVDVAYDDVLVIKGGTFTHDVVQWVPEGYGVRVDVVEEDGKEVIYYTVTDQVVKLESNGAIYHSIRAALVDAVDGDTLTVLVPHRIDSTVAVDKNVTIDFNDCAAYGWGAETYAVFRVLADVTMQGGTVTGSKLGDAYVAIVGSGDAAGTLTITDGSYYGETTVASVTKGTLNIEGGYYEATPYTDENGVEYGYRYTLNCIDANYTAGTAVINVTGGSFYGFDPADNLAEGDSTNFVAEGYVSTEEAATTEGKESIWTVTKSAEPVYVAEVVETGVKYESLQEAMDACADGGTVRLIADIEVDGSDIVSVPTATNGNGKYYNPGIFNLVGDVAVTVDLNGHNITYSGHAVAPYTATANKNYYYNEETGAYEVNSCTIAHGLFLTNNGADLTIVDTAGNAVVNVYGMASAAYSCSPGSTITIEGGSWYNKGCENCGSTNIFLYVSHGGELYIEGGYFDQALDADGNSYLIVEHGGAYANSVIDYSKSKIEITGGTFAGMNPEEAHYFEQTADNKLVMGATTNVVAAGYFAKDNGDGTWTVVSAVEAGYVCWNMQTGVYYETVSAGLNKAEAGQTVQLLTDCAENRVLVTPGVTLDLNGWILNANYVVGFGEADVIDSVRKGMLVVKQNSIVLDEGNAMVPVWNGEGYVFSNSIVDSTSSGLGLILHEADDVAEFSFVTYFNSNVKALLSDGGSDNDLSVVVRLSWNSGDGDVVTQDFIYRDEQVGAIVRGGQKYTLNFNGYAGLENLTVTAMVLTETGAESVGTTHYVN